MYNIYYMDSSGIFKKFGKTLKEESANLFVRALYKVPNIVQVIKLPADVKPLKRFGVLL